MSLSHADMLIDWTQEQIMHLVCHIGTENGLLILDLELELWE